MYTAIPYKIKSLILLDDKLTFILSENKSSYLILN